MTTSPIHGRITGPIVMIGFGSIGKGMLPLIERHFEFDKSRFAVIDPERQGPRHARRARRSASSTKALTPDNYRDMLTPLLTEGGGQGFCVNVSVDTSSRDIMELCRELGALYIDTVAEPWAGFYFDKSAGPEARTNYALREIILDARRRSPGGPTAVNCCGANPGMVSWLVKQALLNVARDIGIEHEEPKSREEWAKLMSRRREGHPHRRARHAARHLREAHGRVRQYLVGGGLRVGGPAAGGARLGHAREMDAGERRHSRRARRRRSTCSSPARTRVCAHGARRQARNTASWSRTTSRSRSPTTSRCARATKVAYRPTCHYAYHPCNEAVLSLHEMFGNAGKVQDKHPHPDRGRDRRRHRRTRRAALRPWQERLLVRLPAFHRGDAPAGALPERHRPAGDVRGARRHGLGAGESESRDRRGRRHRFPPLSRGAKALSRPSGRRLHGLDAARQAVPGSSRRTSTPPIRGSSGTFLYGKR